MLYDRYITNFGYHMKIVIATHNEDKLKELLKAFSNHINKEFYNDKKLLINDLKQFINKNDVIYIKGSRSMKMEEIIMNLDK